MAAMDTHTLSDSTEEITEENEIPGADTMESEDCPEDISVSETVTTQSTIYSDARPEEAVEKIFEAKIHRERVAVKKLNKHAGIFVLRGAGAVSMCVSAAVMAIVLMLCLFIPDFDVTLIAKLSPIAAILTAAELLFAFVKCKNGVRVNVICIAVSFAIMAGCLVGGITAGSGYEEEEKASVEQRLESEIYSACYSELKYVSSISTFRSDVVLNSFSPQKDYTINSIGLSDSVNVEIIYKSFSGSKKSFAEQCRTIMDTFRMLNIPVTTYMFSCEDEFSRLSLFIEGKYQQDYSSDELVQLTHEIVAIDRNYIEDVVTEHVSSEDTEEVTVDETFEFNIGE